MKERKRVLYCTLARLGDAIYDRADSSSSPRLPFADDQYRKSNETDGNTSPPDSFQLWANYFRHSVQKKRPTIDDRDGRDARLATWWTLTATDPCESDHRSMAFHLRPESIRRLLGWALEFPQVSKAKVANRHRARRRRRKAIYIYIYIYIGRPSFHPSVRPSIRPSVHPSVQINI